MSDTTDSLPDSSTSSVARNTLFLEIGGHVQPFSINYERKLAGNFAGRIGVGIVFPGIWYGNMLPAPGSASIGWNWTTSGDHAFEFCQMVAHTISYNDPHGGELLVSVMTGYRYQQKAGGFLFRAGIVPFAYAFESGQYFVLAGLSFGAAF
jgi:hypothetical protein